MDVETRTIYECRCDERLKTKAEESARLACTKLRESFVYYESIKREPKIRGIYECRCDERLQTKSKEFTRLTYTGLVHLKGTHMLSVIVFQS